MEKGPYIKKKTRALDLDKYIRESIGLRIRKRRKELGITQEALAEQMLISKSTISAYENDKVDIKGSVIREIANILYTTPNYLLGYNEYDENTLEIIDMFSKIKDEKIKDLLYIQIKAIVNFISD